MKQVTSCVHSRIFRRKKILPCGHPGESHNLIEGKCGACKIAEDFEKLASGPVNCPADHKLRKCCKEIAALFRKGEMIIDKKNGKSLFDWAQAQQSS